jgi:phenylacetate-CoA ligase
MYTHFVEKGYQLLSKTTPCSAWSHFQELQANQWLSYEQLCEIRWKRLKKLLDFTYENIPYYRKLWKQHGVDPRVFTSLGDIVNLPVVSKKELTEAQENDGFLLSRRGRYEVAYTSGTTEERFCIPFTFSSFQKKYANYLRQVYASGWRLGMKSATLHYSGHTQFKGKYSGRTGDREPFVKFRETALSVAHRRLVLTPYYETASGNEAFAQEWYWQLKGYSPYMFETMDFNLLVLKDYIERNGLPHLSIPKTYVLGTYSCKLRSSLEEFFNTEIFNRYSPHEIEGVALSCQVHKAMHMAIDSYHMEFLDEHNNPVGPEEPGFIVVTDLDNDLMPLIRYKGGDLGHYYENGCTCSRGLPLMGEIDGRARDVFSLKNGTRVAPAAIAAILQDEPAVILFQVVQNRSNEITVKIVPNQSLFSSQVSERVKTRLSNLLGTDETISIALVTHIGLESNGKCSFVKREEPGEANKESVER